jgi:hypothetical protein
MKDLRSELKRGFGFVGLGSDSRYAFKALLSEIIDQGSKPKETFWTPSVAAASVAATAAVSTASITSEPAHLQFQAPPRLPAKFQRVQFTEEEANAQFRAMFLVRA